MALKGWPAPEVWTSLHPALALAKSLERHDALLPVLWGLTFNVLTQGRVAEFLLWVQEMLDIAKATADADLLIAGHSLACICYCYAGEPTKVVAHADKVLNFTTTKGISTLRISSTKCRTEFANRRKRLMDAPEIAGRVLKIIAETLGDVPVHDIAMSELLVGAVAAAPTATPAAATASGAGGPRTDAG